ncbi:MAG: hypothetical protein LBT09_12345 [Planctomycetaceae bacterium]|jgi:hypothetical protein|nr:hypothetical protein [Planctomycetaceae bacterium]
MNKILFQIFCAILFLFNIVNSGGGVIFSQVTPAVVLLNERTFSIPFQVLNDNNVDRTDEVELLVSKDRGGRWYSVGRKPIESKFFLFEADSDGEFWFAFRTITVSGTVKRSVGNSPQIRVIVNTANVNVTQNSNKPIEPAQKIHSQHNHNNAEINTYKVVEGTIQPPKPIVFVKGSEKIAGKKISKNQFEHKTEYNIENNHANDSKNQNKINIEEFDLPATNQKDQESQKSPESKKDQLVDLPFPVSPDSRLIDINNANNIETKSDIAATVESPDKMSKAERRTKLLLRLFDNIAELFRNEMDKDNIDIDSGAGVMVAAVAKKETNNETNGDTNNADASMKIIPVNNRNENDNGNDEVVKSEVAGDSKIADKSVEVPRAVIATGAETVAKNYQSNQNQNQNTNPKPSNDQNTKREVSRLRITGVTMNVATERYQIIVKWDVGEVSVSGKLADVLRSDSAAGVWQPIAVGIPNNGEYWWYISPEDKKPFYLKIRTRNAIDIINEDITKSPIKIND